MGFRIFKQGESMFEAMRKNKTVVLACLLYYLSLKHSKHDIGDLLATYLIADDFGDIGKFDHMHHWLTGVIMKIVSDALKTRKTAKEQAEYILDEIDKVKKDPSFLKKDRDVKYQRDLIKKVRKDLGAEHDW